MPKNLCIIGCGWLGLHVGVTLRDSFDNIYGSYRSSETKNRIAGQGLTPFALDFQKEDCELPSEVIENTTHLLIAVPPFQREQPEIYGSKLAEICELFPKSCNVIFTSSTGVYPQQDGIFDESFRGVDSSVLGYAENRLIEVLYERLTILRLGGLIGGQRHPIKFLSGRQMETAGNEPINLIHRDDIVRLISFLIDADSSGGIFNVSYALDMTKKEYYNNIADRLGLPLPAWGTAEGVQRNISTRKLQNLKNTINGFNLIFNPLDFTFE